MEKKTISLSTLNKVLTPKEMKNVLGGNMAGPMCGSRTCGSRSDCRYGEECGCIEGGKKHCY